MEKTFQVLVRLKIIFAENQMKPKSENKAWTILTKKTTPICVFVVLILFIALLFRLGIWVGYLGKPYTFIHQDTNSYWQTGIELITKGQFPGFLRTPVYPFFLGFLNQIFSLSSPAIALVQISISMITLGLMFYFVYQLFGKRCAIIAMLFFASDIPTCISNNQLITETVFTFMLMCTVIAIVRLSRKDASIVYSSWVGLGFSLLSLCRPIAVLLFIPVAAWYFFILRKNSQRVYIHVLSFLVCSLLLPSAWTYRNYIHTGQIFFSTISSASLYEYRAAWNEARITNRPFYTAQAEFRQKKEKARKEESLNEGELAQRFQAEGIRILLKYPLLTLRQGVEGFFKMYFGISNAGINALIPKTENQPLNFAESFNDPEKKDLGKLVRQTFKGQPFWITAIKGWTILHLLLLYSGFILLIPFIRDKQKNHAVFWLLVIIVGYFTLLSIGAETTSRFRVAIVPMLSILSGIGWATLFEGEVKVKFEA